MRSLNSHPHAGELANAGLDVGRFAQVTIKGEFHGPCPRCGGEDRFVLFTDREWPSYNWFCRVCHPNNGFLDELNPDLAKPPSPEQIAAWKVEAEKRIEAQIEKLQAALRDLRWRRPWEDYHQALTEGTRALWESWGVPRDLQDYWELGYCKDKIIQYDGKFHHSPSVTIPIFEVGTGEALNVRHRLLAPPDPGDKYRPEKEGLPSSPFVADRELTKPERLIVAEGEKKAMVTWITLEDTRTQVVGLPGINFRPEVLEPFRDAENVIVIHDPGATTFPQDVARSLGRRVRGVGVFQKVDDVIVKYELGKGWLESLLRQARRVEVNDER